MLRAGMPHNAGPIDPELVYLAGGYGGKVSGDEQELYSALWQAFNNVQVRVLERPSKLELPLKWQNVALGEP